jgi:hypothetical protein
MHIYLYVKQHQSTGLLYFGKTIKADPFKYKGSGVHWNRHLRKHGADINTIELWGFDNQEDCTRFALEFSEKHCIVESNEWANLVPESGMDGGAPGRICSEDTKIKMRAAKLGRKHTAETKAKMQAGRLGKKHTDETKAKLRKPKSEETKAKMRKPKSEETKAKMRNKIVSEEHIAKMRARKHSEETKAKMRAAKLGRKQGNTPRNPELRCESQDAC